MTTTPSNALYQTIELRWSDQDVLGHVNNAKILTIVEEARVRALRQLKDQASYEGRGSMVIRAMQIDFLTPVHYSDPATVNVWISKLGERSCTFQHELVQSDHRCVMMEAVLVMLDEDQHMSALIPEKLRSAMETIFSDAPTG